MARELIPILDLRRQYASLRDDILAATSAVFESGHFINGPNVDALESDVVAGRTSPTAAARRLLDRAQP